MTKKVQGLMVCNELLGCHGLKGLGMRVKLWAMGLLLMGIFRGVEKVVKVIGNDSLTSLTQYYIPDFSNLSR